MSNYESLKFHHTEDWTSHSTIVVRTGNRDLLDSLLIKISEMSANGFGKIIYSFGKGEGELRIFSQLGSSTDVLYRLLDGQDYDRLSAEASIETIN